jgi:hypothetical protein
MANALWGWWRLGPVVALGIARWRSEKAFNPGAGTGAAKRSVGGLIVGLGRGYSTEVSVVRQRRVTFVGWAASRLIGM